MKLSQTAVDEILHVIATFDRERGIPHDYHDLEMVLQNTVFARDSSGVLIIDHAQIQPRAPATPSARIDCDLDDGIEGKEMLLRAAREWLD